MTEPTQKDADYETEVVSECIAVTFLVPDVVDEKHNRQSFVILI